MSFGLNNTKEDGKYFLTNFSSNSLFASLLLRKDILILFPRNSFSDTGYDYMVKHETRPSYFII